MALRRQLSSSARRRSLLALGAVIVILMSYALGDSSSDKTNAGDSIISTGSAQTGEHAQDEPTAETRTTQNTEAGRAEVVRVVDGDTIVVRIDGQEEKVRLIGIDTPESVDPRKPVECFGKEASRHTSELLPEGTQVRLVRDVEARDRYKRLLAYVYREQDGLFVNLALAADGFAQQATYPPNVAHVEDFSAAVSSARDNKVGLWATCPTTSD